MFTSRANQKNDLVWLVTGGRENFSCEALREGFSSPVRLEGGGGGVGLDGGDLGGGDGEGALETGGQLVEDGSIGGRLVQVAAPGPDRRLRRGKGRRGWQRTG